MIRPNQTGSSGTLLALGVMCLRGLPAEEDLLEQYFDPGLEYRNQYLDALCYSVMPFALTFRLPAAFLTP